MHFIKANKTFSVAKAYIFMKINFIEIKILN